ncbi:MAG: neutral/alkaline non-lysosomal ceramidase N-terminal domain-containing protein [Planctomycetota bacterium]
MLKAGISVTDVTPPVGYRLQGHAKRDKPSRKVHDPLKLKVLTLFDGKNRVAIVTSDLIDFQEEFIAPLRKEVKAKTGIAPENLYVTSSHTHTGPQLHTQNTSMPQEHILPCYIETVRLKIAGCIIEAMNSEEPVTAASGCGNINIGVINRRLMTKNGIEFAPNPEGSVDLDVPVVCFRDRKKQIKAILCVYTCHPTTLGADIFEISGDYPGEAQREIERIYEGATAFFMNGACGDVRPAIIKGKQFAPGRFKDIEKMGRLLAAEVAVTIEEAKPVSIKNVSGKLVRHKFKFDKDFIPQSSAHLDKLAKLHRKKVSEFPYQVDAWLKHFKAKFKKKEKIEKYTPADLHILSLGKLKLIGLPGEVMVDLGIVIKEALGKNTIVTGYTNGVIGYISTKQGLLDGGYEPMTFLFENMSGPYDLKMEEDLIKAVVKAAK